VGGRLDIAISPCDCRVQLSFEFGAVLYPHAGSAPFSSNSQSMLIVLSVNAQPNEQFLAGPTATQYDRLLASCCGLSVRLSVCDVVHCGSRGRCTGLKVVPACS